MIPRISNLQRVVQSRNRCWIRSLKMWTKFRFRRRRKAGTFEMPASMNKGILSSKCETKTEIVTLHKCSTNVLRNSSSQVHPLRDMVLTTKSTTSHRLLSILGTITKLTTKNQAEMSSKTHLSTNNSKVPLKSENRQVPWWMHKITTRTKAWRS